MGILDSIHTPEDLRKISEDSLLTVCEEVRRQIIDECAANPGHLGSSLGVVELTVALHYALNTPYDNLIWDVGHQSYAHKILTGRKELFKYKRTFGGISGFPRMSESPYDSFGTGHASTSVSAALGMAEAARIQGEPDRLSVAVIGDGSFTGGMPFEALNNANTNNANLLIILNDNNMAIDPNVGGLSKYLLDISTSATYNRVKNKIWHMLGGGGHSSNSRFRSFLQNVDGNLKTFLLKQSNLFEAMGLRYFGPVNGHDVNHLVKVLRDLHKIKGPKVLHCITVKGKGFKCAEADQTTWHAPGKYDPITGEIFRIPRQDAVKFQDVFGQTVLELARANDKIVGITPAMPSGCSLNIMMKEMPKRCFDVGIAEEHAVTFSAGLAAKGLVPFCNIYSSFMQRAYDQIIHDVALQKLHVVFCLDRGGLVGADGATHHGAFDLAYLRCVPNMTIAAPINEEELRQMMYTAQLPDMGPFAIRYPRGYGSLPLDAWRMPFRMLQPGVGQCLTEGSDVAVISIGTVGVDVQGAMAELPAGKVAHYDLRYLKPIDETLLHTVFRKFNRVLTVEDGCIMGGMGDAVLEFMAEHGYEAKVKRLGIPDKFIEHGTVAQLRVLCGFDKESIVRELTNMLA